MYGGNSGCTGIVVYNSDIKGDNAVYGYYINEEMHFETGEAKTLQEIRRAREADRKNDDRISVGKVLLLMLFAVVFLVACFIALPLRISFAVLVFAVISFIPLAIIAMSRQTLYKYDEDMEAFRRYHGCEHAIIQSLTKGKECSEEVLRKANYYDTECGTAYAGYTVCVAAVLALLIIFWPGLLKAAGILLLTAVILVTMILVPRINPFILIQRRVVSRPEERELKLGLEIMKRMKEL